MPFNLQTTGQRAILNRIARLGSVVTLAYAVSACASYPRFQTHVSQGAHETSAPQGAAAQTISEVRAGRAGASPRLRTRFDFIRGSKAKEADKGAAEAAQAVAPATLSQPVATAEEIAALLPEKQVQATLPPQPLPQFIDTVFGQVLKTPYFTGPNVAARTEIVSLRGPVAVSNRAFFAMAQSALREYGLLVTIEGNSVRIVEDPTLSNQTPLFIRDRSSPDTPEPSRPVVQFFELRSLDVKSVMALLSETYPNRGKVHFSPRDDMNTLVISGNARDVSAAAAVVDAIDRARFADGQVARIEPMFWASERLADAVSQALRTEGYNVGLGADNSKEPIVFLPVPFSNDMLVFANRKDLFDRAMAWVEKLDRPASFGDQENIFVYDVKNTTASELGALIAQSSPESAPSQQTAPIRRQPLPRQNAAPLQQQQASLGSGKITVDAAGNRILFRGTPSEFERARAVMVKLDTPPQQVLVEMTVAEVTLSDQTRFGVEWFLNQLSSGDTLNVSTQGGSAREAGGLGVTLSRAFPRGKVVAALNAFAKNNNINILSTPRLLARSGSEAQILIGADVPIITSQRAADQQTGGNTDILQTVQYRQTGVILNVRPVVYGDDRVEIDLYQEVSSQSETRITGIASPLISNRSVSTKLALREGTTAVIGGMIQDNYTRTQTGVPLLKDAPLIGQAFRADGVTGDKTELLILVTPYIMRTDDQLSDATATYSASINRLLNTRGARTYTLLPWRSPLAGRQVHGGLDPRRNGPIAAAYTPAGVDEANVSGPLLSPGPNDRDVTTAPRAAADSARKDVVVAQ